MAIVTIPELLDVVIMSAAIGYIFHGYFSRFNPFRKHNAYDYVGRQKFNWSDFLFSIYVVGPAIILHELGHKFVAMGFGHDATFFSALSINKLINGIPFFDFAAMLMIIAIVMTYFGSSFLFFVPAYVAFSAAATPLQSLLIAFAGPALNLVLWLGASFALKKGKVPHKYVGFAVITSKINMYLFIFNMLPIPGFDGFRFYEGLFRVLF